MRKTKRSTEGLTRRALLSGALGTAASAAVQGQALAPALATSRQGRPSSELGARAP